MARVEVQRVRELHQEHDCGDGPCVDKGKCQECQFEFPCDTIRALDARSPEGTKHGQG